jgi:hypothetical protein
MVSRDGRPFSGHVATATSTAFDKNFTSKHPRRLCLLLPCKRAGKGLYMEANDERKKDQSHFHHRRSTSQAISIVLSLFL